MLFSGTSPCVIPDLIGNLWSALLLKRNGHAMDSRLRENDNVIADGMGV